MQLLFPGLFDAFLADDVGAAVVAQLAGTLQLFVVAFGDAADITHHVRGRHALRVFTHPACPQFHARKLESVRGEPGGLGVVQIVAQEQAGVAAGFRRAPLEAPLIRRADVDDFGQALEQLVHVAGMGRHHFQRIGTVVARQDFAVAIQDLAAPRRNRHHRDAVAVRAFGQAFVTVNLQIPEPADQHAEAHQGEHAAHPGAQAEALLLLLAGFLEFKHHASPPSGGGGFSVVGATLRQVQDPARQRPQGGRDGHADAPVPARPLSRQPGVDDLRQETGDEEHRQHVHRLAPEIEPLQPTMQHHGAVGDERIGQGMFAQQAGVVHVHQQAEEERGEETDAARFVHAPEGDDQQQHVGRALPQPPR
ncbi:hypothetical protein D3C72_952200 [compost metagenome]